MLDVEMPFMTPMMPSMFAHTLSACKTDETIGRDPHADELSDVLFRNRIAAGVDADRAVCIDTGFPQLAAFEHGTHRQQHAPLTLQNLTGALCLSALGTVVEALTDCQKMLIRLFQSLESIMRRKGFPSQLPQDLMREEYAKNYRQRAQVNLY